MLRTAQAKRELLRACCRLARDSAAASTSSSSAAPSASARVARGFIAWRRHASSSSSAPASSEASEPPSSSPPAGTASASGWKRPIAPGVEPAYDEALAFLAEYQQGVRKQLEALRSSQSASSSNSPEDAESLAAQIEELEILAELQDPKARWEFANGQIDMSRPVHRYLREQAWRRPSTQSSSTNASASGADAGPLAKLSERLRLMRVVPDVVPFAAPTADLQVFFGDGPGFGDHGGSGGEVQAGVFLDAHVTLSPPRVSATVFHPSPRPYTLVLLDADVPDEGSASYTTYAHWLLEDVPLSATQSAVSAAQDGAREALSYVPPHPQRGTPYHRYVSLLLTKDDAAGAGAEADASATAAPASTDAPAPEQQDLQREGFDVRAYMARRGLAVAGIHFWREQWEAGRTARTVSKIYSDVLKQPEPLFDRPPKHNPYKDVNTGEITSRYYASDSGAV